VTRGCLEQGARWTFACAVDKPGWARRGTGDEAVIEELLAQADRQQEQRQVLAAGLDHAWEIEDKSLG